MSANNQYFVIEKAGTWYGWDLMAEAHDNSGKCVVSLSTAVTGDTLNELEERLSSNGFTAEYGISTEPYLVKDGTPIEVVA